MWPDPWVMAVAVPAVIFAGVSKGGFGSGAAFAAAPILALAIDPRMAVGLLLPLLMLIDVFTLKSFWKQWHGPSALALALGSLPGIALAIRGVTEAMAIGGSFLALAGMALFLWVVLRFGVGPARAGGRTLGMQAAE